MRWIVVFEKGERGKRGGREMSGLGWVELFGEGMKWFVG